MDGNFSAEHMKLKNDNDFDLTGGSGYFTASPRYQAHLQIADDKQPKSTCHEHKAVNQVHATQKHLAATGIRAIACARHGCFVPDTIVDFQKGKQQVNMDYALCRALGKLEGMPRAAIIYDIACQFNVHFGARVLRSDYLKFSDTIQIIWGIRLFHIHGHQDVCLSRYSPDLIPGIGKVDGEVLETLWSQLNEICGSTCSMTAAHRREVLNDHMLDSNRKKMLNIVQSLSRKYIQALQASEVAEEGYRNLTANTDQSLITQWIVQAEEAQTRCFANVTAMDIFDVQLQCAPTRAEMQLQLAEDPAQPSSARGVTSWLSLGLKIEELHRHSFLYRTAVRQAKHSQHKKSRAWDAVHQVNTALNVHTAIYRRCRKAMITLGSKTIEIDPSVTGTRRENFPWFWTMNADLQAGNWMSEFLWVKFHHVKANIDRCTEEVALLKMEMRWAANFFQHHSDKWRRFAAEAEAKWDMGRVCFTKKQTKTWGTLHEQVITLIHRFRLA
ncbi:hypothetical protein PAXINDRAFT_18134 [Paxillus involutus ATCC 200175]|uniref:CxC2-like cysteine cluster KDZ transposase-associated domain-containing protein n=1 Tax=Paxillus involutus ATCC 200175 TaxID=664439 RepID=A0A0C9TLV9_PAXIN|nr:hypothetical protein PAXINDRAFT_18134 [Paxillus involutus ATCC 200175]